LIWPKVKIGGAYDRMVTVHLDALMAGVGPPKPSSGCSVQ
jgi:hypothetical protein